MQNRSTEQEHWEILQAALHGSRRRRLADVLGAMPNVGKDLDFLLINLTGEGDRLSVYGAIFEIYLREKADRALIRQYRYMDSLFSFSASALRSSHSTDEKLKILRSLGHACLAEHAQWALAHRDMRIDGLRW